MARVTLDEMVDVIREAERPVTAGDIAEAVGVTRQAIGKRREELEGDDRVEYGKVGQATAYWLAKWHEENEPELPAGAPPPQPSVEETGNEEGVLRRIFDFGTSEGMSMPGVVVLIGVFVGVPAFAGLVLRRVGWWIQEPFVSLLQRYYDDDPLGLEFVITFLTIFGVELGLLSVVAAFLGFPQVAIAGFTSGFALGTVAVYLFMAWFVWGLAAAVSWSISSRVLSREVTA